MVRFIFFFLFLPRLLLAGEIEEILTKADQNYRQGEAAEALEERTERFNQALSQYVSLEKESSDGRLFYNIGNCYFQLQEYPRAILYYEKALKDRPRNEKIQYNLELARVELALIDRESVSILTPLRYLHEQWSMSEKLRAFFFLACFMWAGWAIMLFRPSHLVKKVATGLTAVSALLFMDLIAHRYIASIEAILIQPSSLYRDVGIHYAKVVDEPVQSGTKVEVVEVLHSGQWIKVVTPEGSLGYMPGEGLRII